MTKSRIAIITSQMTLKHFNLIGRETDIFLKQVLFDRTKV